MRRVLALLAVAFLLAACGPDAPTTGYVRDKRYHPAWTEHWVSYDCVYRDPKGVCYGYTANDHYDYHPEEFQLYLENCDATDDKGKPKCSKGWRSVPGDDYNSHPTGTHYPDPR